MPDAKLALVLGGGGNLGVVQIAFIEALQARGIEPDLVVGTSVGALNASYVAFHQPGREVQCLEEAWLALRGQRMFHRNPFRIGRHLLRNRISLYDGEFVSNLLVSHLEEDDFDAARVPLLITASNISRGSAAVFSEGSIRQAVLASTAIPGIFPPVQIDGDWYVDGGIAHGLGVEVAVDAGADVVLAIDLSSGMAHRKPSSVVEVLTRSLEIMGQRRSECQLEHSGHTADIVVWRPGLTAPHGSAAFEDVELLLGQARELAGPLIDLARDGMGGFRAGVYEGAVRSA
jgi:NTE family protein